MAFDSLSFARRLKAAGFSEAQAEALADANRDQLVHDLDITILNGAMAAMEQRFQALIETQTLRLTVRMGVMLPASLSLMTAVMGVMLRFH
jgi:hypothetical protein